MRYEEILGRRWIKFSVLTDQFLGDSCIPDENKKNYRKRMSSDKLIAHLLVVTNSFLRLIYTARMTKKRPSRRIFYACDLRIRIRLGV